MFSGLSYKPYEDMAVEHHVFKLEFLLVLVLVNECRLEFALFSYVEFLDLDLLREINSVL